MSSHRLFSTLTKNYTKATGLLENFADIIPNLLIRIILAWEFWERKRKAAAAVKRQFRRLMKQTLPAKLY